MEDKINSRFTKEELLELFKESAKPTQEEKEEWLRDQFAIHCPTTLETYLMGVDPEKIKTWKAADALASFSASRYQYADAMLKARQS